MKRFRRVSRQSVSLICLTALLFGSFAQALAQQTAPAKRALTHKDYDSWHSIQAPQISRDGKFVAYAYMAQDGDSEIVVRNLATGVDQRAPRGYHPPVPPPDDPGANIAEFQAAQARLVRPVFTADSRFVMFSIDPTKAEVNKAKREKKKPEDMPKNALGIIDVSNGQVTRIEKIKNFQVPEDGSVFIAFLREPTLGSGTAVKEGAKEPPTTPSVEPSPNASSAATASPIPKDPQSSRGSSARSQKKKEYGSDLVLRNVTTVTQPTLTAALH